MKAKGVGMICRQFCFDNGLIMRAVGDTMIISPPLVISKDEIDELVTKARKCLDLTLEGIARLTARLQAQDNCGFIGNCARSLKNQGSSLESLPRILPD
jgi:hypothetical protein